ncbi:hypothetical protein DITRI_Ditri01bG0151600 [Diplodiscus trichospermus]
MERMIHNVREDLRFPSLPVIQVAIASGEESSQDQVTCLSSKLHKKSLEACSSSDDKISNLPDALIHRILLFLSTKQAVATSLLSKRWVSLWILVPALDLEDSNRCRVDEQAKMKFICSAIKQGLQEVDISASKEAEEGLVKLPSSLFLVKTLKILKLQGGIIVDVPGSVCFPSLKILNLLRVNYANAESFRLLISGCLSLEELRVEAPGFQSTGAWSLQHVSRVWRGLLQ